MLRLYHNKKIKHYMVVDTVILRLYHNKTLHEGRYNHRKIISQYIWIYIVGYIFTNIDQPR